MRPGVLLPVPEWNLALVCWMELQTFASSEMGVEERERQLTGTRPKTMAVALGGFSRFAPGELCPLEDLNPAHDGSEPR
jgi:hypothetical protein